MSMDVPCSTAKYLRPTLGVAVDSVEFVPYVDFC